MAEQEQDRSEQATPFKLEEARKRGSVSKSTELNSVLAIIAFLVILTLMGPRLITRQFQMGQRILGDAHNLNFDQTHVVSWLSDLLIQMLYLLGPLFFLLALLAIFGNIIQTGPIFSFFTLKPDLDRINPVSGLKRLFTLKLLFEAIKSVIKLSLMSAVVYVALKSLLPSILDMMQIDIKAYPLLGLQAIKSIIFKLAAVLGLIALLDVMYTRWDYGKKMRMSRREMKDEVKRREGDPRIKARIRELQRETLKRSKGLNRVKDADVLITNPQHLAIALLYKREKMQAPEIVAKGAGEMALKMKEYAREHRVPIVENKPLARALFRCRNESVPEKLFSDIARILIWAYALRTPKVHV